MGNKNSAAGWMWVTLCGLAFLSEWKGFEIYSTQIHEGRMIVTEEEEQEQELIRIGNKRCKNKPLVTTQNSANFFSLLPFPVPVRIKATETSVLSAEDVYLSIPNFILRPPPPNLPRVLLHAEMKSLGK